MKNTQQLLIGGIVVAGLGLLVAVLSGGGSTRRITSADQLSSIEGDRFVVFVYSPSDPEADPEVAEFLALEAEGVTFVAISNSVIQQWGGLADIEVQEREAIVAVDVDAYRRKAFPLNAGLEFAVKSALAFLEENVASFG